MARRGPEPAGIALTKRQRDELETVARDEGARLRQRATIVLAAADGTANREITVSVGVSDNTVSTWRTRFAEAGRLRCGSPSSGRSRTTRGDP